MNKPLLYHRRPPWQSIGRNKCAIHSHSATKKKKKQPQLRETQLGQHLKLRSRRRDVYCSRALGPPGGRRGVGAFSAGKEKKKHNPRNLKNKNRKEQRSARTAALFGGFLDSANRKTSFFGSLKRAFRLQHPKKRSKTPIFPKWIRLVSQIKKCQEVVVNNT